MKQLYSVALILLITATALRAQVTLSADGPGNTYDLIESKGFGIETPDCRHTSFGPHVTEIFDNTLGKYVFVFHSHPVLDDDRCTNDDRTRMEIKGGNGSPADLQHTSGQTAYYRWKFKLDAGFKPSSRFTHIFQIKAIDGDAGAPLITITPRAGSPEKMQIIHSSGSGTGGLGTVTQVDLAPFKGQWIEAYVKYKSSEGSAGTFEIVLKRLSDGATLLTYSRNDIDMWREGASYNRPKWGVYRGKDAVLRDEQVLFADFCVTESSASLCPSDIGNTNQPPTVSISSPSNNASFSAPATINIEANAADTDGNISKVEFFNGSTKLGEDLIAPYSFSWSGVAAGSYAITAKATDNGNATTTSTTVNVIVISGNQVLLTPTHDAYVRTGANGGIAHGATDPNSLVVKLYPGTQVDNGRETYLTFDLSSVNQNIIAANLKVYGTVDGTTALSIPVSAYSVANTGWTESTITNNNKPATGGSLASTNVTNGTPKYYLWNIGAYLQAERAAGRQVVSIALKATATSDPRLLFNSKETGNNPPQLDISTSPDTIQQYTFVPVADAYVRDGTNAAITHGVTDSTLLITKVSPAGQLNNAREAYLRFNLSQVTGTVSSAQLRVYGKVDGTTTPSVPVALFPCANTTWNENSITWNNKPVSGNTALDTTTVTNVAYAYFTWDITSYVQSELTAGRADIALVMKSLAAHDPRIFWNASEAGSNPPQLIVNITPDESSDGKMSKVSAGGVARIETVSKEGATMRMQPNPFQQSGVVHFYLPEAGQTTITAWDLMGRRVAVLVNTKLPAGEHRAVFHAAGAGAVYILTLTHNGKTITTKVRHN